MKILLHMCCANCAIYPVKKLREKNHLITGFFYNPNIHPYQEYQRRLGTVKEYAPQVELNVIYRNEYALEEFLAKVAQSPQNRCDYCYLSRLEATAQTAAEKGFEAFTTTLLYSRYQQHEKIKVYGEKLAGKYGTKFYYEDFRLGWKEGIAVSKAMELYRQQYCGCIYSEKDRFCPHQRNGSA